MLYCLNRMLWKEKGEQGENQNQSRSINHSLPLLSGRDSIKVAPSSKELADALKIEWRKLWQERVDDKLRAEGVATSDYCDLFVEKGTIIHATRDYKALNFKDILKQHQVANPERFITPDPQVGGWHKFIKTSITNQPSRKKSRAELYREEKREKQKPKKGGRGWLHL
jgi:hypothetical protein